jgi:GNAT superfamily N-acetyltransferase
MEFVVLGWPPDGPTLRLDWQRFSYAGKFVMSTTGKAVVRDPTETTDGEFADEVLAAVAFNPDRTDPDALWLRYVTVRDDRRGEGLGPRLCAFVAERALDRGYTRLRIAVNNPYSYEALYKAGFGYTGRETGLVELVLERPDDRSLDRYRAGLDRFRDRDLSSDERAFLDSRAALPPTLDPPE